jgi:glycosyltransferase involved in cell wall biosynthesis
MRIAFLCFPTAAGRWTAESVEDGIGGSEEAVIHMAALLARRGHHVGVHMRAGRRRRMNGVSYGDFQQLYGQRLDVAVIWRRAALLDELDRQRVSAARRYLWLHDNVSVDTILGRQLELHKVMVLSAYHRRRYPELGDERFFVTSNGIDPAEFEVLRTPRSSQLLVYGSDYVRGLRTLLHAWPAIRRAVPQARLNVFYGWQGLQRRDPARAARLQEEFNPLLCQPGITHLGRIGHAAVAAQYVQAAVWAYPCWYRETSCISAMKAQAGGAVPAVIPSGALAETVQFGFRTRFNYDQLSEGTSPEELAAEWREGLIDLLRSPDRQEEIRAAMVPAARRSFAWSGVADAWEREFGSV